MQDPCPVCLEKNNEYQIFGCKHGICMDCLQYMTDFVCPICRKNFENDIPQDVAKKIKYKSNLEYAQKISKILAHNISLSIRNSMIYFGYSFNQLPPEIKLNAKDSNIETMIDNQIKNYALDPSFELDNSRKKITVLVNERDGILFDEPIIVSGFLDDEILTL